jgi:urease accessory protein
MITTMLMIAGAATRMTIRMAEPDDTGLPLLVWLSPAFPVGAFAYSHALEWAVEAGDVTDAATAQDWIDDLLRFGSGRNDAVLLAAAWRAAMARDRTELANAAELAVALQPSMERRLETTAQGNAFLTAIAAAWPTSTVDDLRASWPGDVAYPVALGVAAAGHGIALARVLDGFLLGFVSNIVSAIARLGPIGQTDGQRILGGLIPLVRETAGFAATSTLDDLGGAAFRSDIASMRHETQYTRLFRS